MVARGGLDDGAAADRRADEREVARSRCPQGVGGGDRLCRRPTLVVVLEDERPPDGLGQLGRRAMIRVFP
jgi:hypothetical protein